MKTITIIALIYISLIIMTLLGVAFGAIPADSGDLWSNHVRSILQFFIR